MTLSERTGSPLTDTLKNTTHRQFLVWRWHFFLDLNRPSRTDHYMMQVAQKIVQVNCKAEDAKQVRLDDFKLPFTVKKVEPPKPLTPEEKKKQVKADLALYTSLVGGTKNGNGT